MTLPWVIALQEDCASFHAATQGKTESLMITSCIPTHLALYCADIIGNVSNDF
jgi:hypothetical protein